MKPLRSSAPRTRFRSPKARLSYAILINLAAETNLLLSFCEAVELETTHSRDGDMT